MEKINLQELEELAKPLVELLRAKGNPYTKVVVEQSKITGIPLPYED